MYKHDHFWFWRSSVDLQLVAVMLLSIDHSLIFQQSYYMSSQENRIVHCLFKLFPYRWIRYWIPQCNMPQFQILCNMHTLEIFSYFIFILTTFINFHPALLDFENRYQQFCRDLMQLIYIYTSPKKKLDCSGHQVISLSDQP